MGRSGQRPLSNQSRLRPDAGRCAQAEAQVGLWTSRRARACIRSPRWHSAESSWGMTTASCIRWTPRRAAFIGPTKPICSAGSLPSLLRSPATPGTRYAIFFVTRSTNAYALDAHDGKLLWKTQVRTGLNNLSATAAYHDGRLYVPMSGTETLVGARSQLRVLQVPRGRGRAGCQHRQSAVAHAERSGAAAPARRKLKRQATVGTRGRFGVEHAHRRC